MLSPPGMPEIPKTLMEILSYLQQEPWKSQNPRWRSWVISISNGRNPKHHGGDPRLSPPGMPEILGGMMEIQRYLHQEHLRS